MRLIVGLGNPGKKYQKTRHNLGYRVIEKLQKLDLKNIVLLKPATFVNLSGNVVLQQANFYKIKPQDILVICDDLDLSLGEVRFRQKGGSGGHKGLISIIDALKTENFPRIRIGIGRPPKNVPAEKYVLQNFTKEEEAVIKKSLDQVVEMILKLISEDKK